MARPPLGIGQSGKINAIDETKPDGPLRWRAYARHRDADGVTRKVEKWADTEDKAKAALRRALRERAKHPSTSLAAASTFGEVANQWIEQVRLKRKATTYDTYYSHLKVTVLPGVGHLRLRECTVGRLQDFLDALAYRKTDPLSASSLRTVRTILRGTLNLAQHRGVLTTNPAKDLNPIEGTARPARAYTAEQLTALLAKLDADKKSARADLPDLIRVLFGTGVRIGEALGLRWRDINLADQPVLVDGEEIPPESVWINGNIVYVRKKGLVRHDGKTTAADRKISLPVSLQLLLSMRQPITNNPDEPVFLSETLGWRNPRNVSRAIRRMRTRLEVDDFTSHIGRKTVATMLDKAGQTARAIADQLGHRRPSMTQDVYMGRGEVNPGAAAALDAAQRTS